MSHAPHITEVHKQMHIFQ